MIDINAFHEYMDRCTPKGRVKDMQTAADAAGCGDMPELQQAAEMAANGVKSMRRFNFLLEKINAAIIEKTIIPMAERGLSFTGNKRGPSQTTAELIEQLRMILMDIGPGANFHSVKRHIKEMVAAGDTFFQEVDRESETVYFITSEGSEGKVTFKTIENHLSFIRKKYFHK